MSNEPENRDELGAVSDQQSASAESDHVEPDAAPMSASPPSEGTPSENGPSENGPAAAADGAEQAASEGPASIESDVPAVSESADQSPAVEAESVDAVPADEVDEQTEVGEQTESENAEAEEPVVEEPEEESEEELKREWFIVKVQVNREDSIRAALLRRIKIAGLEEFFGQVVIPTEDVAEYNKAGKRRIVKKKLYPGYIMVELTLNDDTWFLVRETPGIGDFTGSAGKPTPMDAHEVQRIIHTTQGDDTGEAPIKTAIPFKIGDRVRVKEGNFENFEGEVDAIDEANGRVTIMINIFGRSTPVELEHWQIEAV